MNLRRRINRARDLALSAAGVVGAPIVGAVGGAILLTAAMSVIAYFTFIVPEDYEDNEDLGKGGV